MRLVLGSVLVVCGVVAALLDAPNEGAHDYDSVERDQDKLSWSEARRVVDELSGQILERGTELLEDRFARDLFEAYPDVLDGVPFEPPVEYEGLHFTLRYDTAAREIHMAVLPREGYPDFYVTYDRWVRAKQRLDATVVIGCGFGP